MTRVSIEEVRDELSDGGDDVTIVDSRSGDAWGQSDIKAAGAVRIPPDEVEKHFADVNRDHRVFVYCT
jgi:rhodanese-related sulfurtransferase